MAEGGAVASSSGPGLLTSPSKITSPFIKESSMLSRTPKKFNFDMPLPPPPLPIKTIPSPRITTTQNPTYFDDGFPEPEIHYQQSIPRPPAPPPDRDQRIFTLPPIIPIHRIPPSPNQIPEAENDVFLPDSSKSPSLQTQNLKSSKLSRLTSFFKFKSSNSVSSKTSSTNSSGISTNSPPFTPDSSLSIYTNSLDSDSDGEVHFYQPIRTQDEEMDELSSLPVYYNDHRRSFRSRNNSLPGSSSCSANQPPTYYNAPQLSTFSKRRHSIASSENSYANLQNSAAGYLVPIQTRNTQVPPPSSSDNIYLNELPFPTKDASKDEEIVRVEVHTPTSSQAYSDMFSSSSASTTVPHYIHPQTYHAQLRQCTSSDSSSTIEAILSPNLGRVENSRVKRDFEGAGAVCEAYCQFCSSYSVSAAQNSRSGKMNIGILSSQDCFFSQRAESQLRKIFETIVGSDRKKLNLTLQSFDMRDVNEIGKATELHRSKIQIVIISHRFLDRLRHELNVEKRVSQINKILRKNRVIGVLLSGVLGTNQKSSSEEIIEGFQQYLLQFAEWETLELKPSSKLEPEFYKSFTETVQRMYTAEQKPESGFSLFPKKVTKHHPKVVLFFKKSLENDDTISVELKKGRQKEHVQEVVLVNPYSGIIQMPSSLFDDDRSSLIEITVTVNGEKLGAKVLKYDHNSQIVDDDVFVEENGNSNSTSSCNGSETSSSSSTRAGEYYDLPRPIRQDYCIPPPARPVVPAKPKKNSAGNQNLSVKRDASTTNDQEEVPNYANFVAAEN